MRVIGIVLALVAAAVTGCGGGSTAQERIDRCVEGNMPLSSKAAAGFPELKQSVRRLCGVAERAGYLNDQGSASAEHNRSVLLANSDMLAPFCRAVYASVQTGRGLDERYLPKGGVYGLTANMCSNLRPYINDKADGIDTMRLWYDRGREFAVPLCVAAGLTKVAKQAGITRPDWRRAGPFTRTDWLKVLTRTCREAWDQGLFPSKGEVNVAAYDALFVKTAREMIRAGDITVLR
jgi:hypothetical protein